jgi:hypothetical protein
MSHRLLRKLLALAVAIVLIWAVCVVVGPLVRPSIGNMLPPPPGGCPPAVSTAAAIAGMETLRSGDMGYLEEQGLTPPQATALARGDYEGCP